MSQRDVKQRIDSVKNIRKITSAMQMVAAARLRRAEQRIAALRPYAGAVRRMTRRAAMAAGSEATGNPILVEREDVKAVAVLLVTGDRGLARALNSQIIRAGTRAPPDARAAGQLEHPHLVVIYDLGHLEGAEYIAMQLLAGGSLTARLRDQGVIAVNGPFGEQSDASAAEQALASTPDHTGLGGQHRVTELD